MLRNAIVVVFESKFLSQLISRTRMYIFVDLTLPGKIKRKSVYSFVNEEKSMDERWAIYRY